jgi:TolB protein
MRRTNALLVSVLAAGCAALVITVHASQQQPPAVSLTIRGEPGAMPRYAVPDLVALTGDPADVEAARTIGRVLWDDLNFEREFDMIPRDTYTSIPEPRAPAEIPFDQWRELGADALVFGTVQHTGDTLRVEIHLYSVRSRQAVAPFPKEYSGPAANPRLYAHTIADEIFQSQLGLRGVARTKIAFVSDRDQERLTGTIEKRTVKEVYICDYDGANQKRLTVNRTLNINPTWSPDGRAVAYTSYRRGLPDIFIANIYQGTSENPTRGKGENFLPVWSPDGTKIAFMSDRDGNPEIYVMNRDGSNIVRLTHHPMSDTSPTWSPSGTEIAFVSDRRGSPQIYVMDAADGRNLRALTSESYCDRPTWSPPPFNEIAYCSRSGAGTFDVKVLDLATGERRQLTFGEGSNESPAYAPNGRHIAFSSTRTGTRQIYTIERTGRDLRQLTKIGNNQTPDWSR